MACASQAWYLITRTSAGALAADHAGSQRRRSRPGPRSPRSSRAAAGRWSSCRHRRSSMAGRPGVSQGRGFVRSTAADERVPERFLFRPRRVCVILTPVAPATEPVLVWRMNRAGVGDDSARCTRCYSDSRSPGLVVRHHDAAQGRTVKHQQRCRDVSPLPPRRLPAASLDAAERRPGPSSLS